MCYIYIKSENKTVLIIKQLKLLWILVLDAENNLSAILCLGANVYRFCSLETSKFKLHLYNFTWEVLINDDIWSNLKSPTDIFNAHTESGIKLWMKK